MEQSNVLQILQSGSYDNAFVALYGRGNAAAARERASRLVESFQKSFPASFHQAVLFSAPGRTEIGGNHTDHQRGHVLCGSVDMDTLACAAPNGSREIRVVSEGYAPLRIDLEQLAPNGSERNTTAALVRGVAAKIAEQGYSVGGFDACVTSNVLSGMGLSSSAAFEVLMGNIINHFFCHGTLDSIRLAKIGQYAENVYFGKPCGLMDQMGCSVGGAISIDFADPESPTVKKAGYDFSRSGHALCIIDTGSDHADLTDDYAAIPREMGEVAAHFGKSVLRDVPEEQFYAELSSVRARCGDRAVLRAMHFYDDDRAALEEAAALEAGDFDRFLALVNASGLSSAVQLQNTCTFADPKRQAVSQAIALAKRLLDGTGAVRVHGGGFAGTIQAFVPENRLEGFKSGIERVYGEGSCHILRIRPQGGCVITPE